MTQDAIQAVKNDISMQQDNVKSRIQQRKAD
jgi:hypothetical protein